MSLSATDSASVTTVVGVTVVETVSVGVSTTLSVDDSTVAVSSAGTTIGSAGVSATAVVSSPSVGLDVVPLSLTIVGSLGLVGIGWPVSSSRPSPSTSRLSESVF